MGNELDLGKIFATLSFFQFIQFPLTILPQLFAVIADIMNSASTPMLARSANVLEGILADIQSV
jgi:hypothetical protein